MKQFITFLASVFLFAATAQAQVADEAKKTMSKGVQNGYTIEVSDLDSKEVEKLWKDYQKDFKGRKAAKWDRKAKEFFMDDAEIPSLSGNSIDVYSTIESKGDNSAITVWFDLGGAYLSSDTHAEKMEKLNDWFYAFDVKVRTRVVELELEGEEDKFKDMEKEYEKLQKDQKKLEESIEDYKQKIIEAEKELESNIAAQQNQMKALEGQQQMVEEVKKKLKKVE